MGRLNPRYRNMLEELMDIIKKLRTTMLQDHSKSAFKSVQKIREHSASAVEQHIRGFKTMKQLYDEGFLRHFKAFLHDMSMLLHIRFIELLNQIRINLQNYLRCF